MRRGAGTPKLAPYALCAAIPIVAAIVLKLARWLELPEGFIVPIILSAFALHLAVLVRWASTAVVVGGSLLVALVTGAILLALIVSGDASEITHLDYLICAIVTVGVAIVSTLCGAAILVIAAAISRWKLRRDPEQCCSCLYDLQGLTAATPCPECGSERP